LTYVLQRRVENIKREANSSKVQSYGVFKGATSSKVQRYGEFKRGASPSFIINSPSPYQGEGDTGDGVTNNLPTLRPTEHLKEQALRWAK